MKVEFEKLIINKLIKRQLKFVIIPKQLWQAKFFKFSALKLRRS